MTTDLIKVLIVEDSPVASDLLSYIINSDPALQVMAQVESGEKALEYLKTHSPDVITMDIIMPKMNGFETTRRIMQVKPTPIVIISATFNKEDVNLSFKAIETGALSILEKPKGFYDPDYKRIAKEIVSSIKTVAGIKLITRHYSTREVELPVRSASLFTTSGETKPSSTKIEAVGIGASLGGPQALRTIFSELPNSFPVPIYLVQHISTGFIQGFVDWLNEISQLNIKVAKNYEEGLPGYVYVAPDNYHMEVVKPNVIKLVQGDSTDSLKPSVAHLFSSMAKTFGSHSIGVILTGMGHDGAEQLLEMKEQGAITIAQDQESSLIFGMPKEAILLGAATRVTPLSQIAEMLIRLLQIQSKSKI